MNNSLDKTNVYGLSLENIEQVQIKNKEFFKLTNPETKSIRIIENQQSNFNLSEQFKRIQNDYSFARNGSEMDNANAVFEFVQKYNKRELSLINVDDLIYESNGKLELTHKFNQFSARLSQVQLFELIQLLKVSKMINLKLINVENQIGVDDQNRIIGSTYNSSIRNCDIDLAKVLKFENDKVSTDTNFKEVDLNSIDYETIVNDLEVANDTPIEIAGENISKSELDKFYNYPELIEKDDNMSETKKSIITRLLEILRLKRENNNTKGKQKVFKNNKSVVENILFIISVTAFISGAAIVMVI